MGGPELVGNPLDDVVAQPLEPASGVAGGVTCDRALGRRGRAPGLVKVTMMGCATPTVWPLYGRTETTCPPDTDGATATVPLGAVAAIATSAIPRLPLPSSNFSGHGFPNPSGGPTLLGCRLPGANSNASLDAQAITAAYCRYSWPQRMIQATFRQRPGTRRFTPAVRRPIARGR